MIELIMIEYPNILNKIFDKLDKNNAKPIIIGGYIRDFLLKTISDDIDIEVYNVSSFKKLEKLLKEFGSTNSVGKSFGVCKLKIDNLNLDFTLPRIDSKVASGHLGFNISIKENLDFTTATRRRDFTINAIGYDVIEKKILDPFNGIKDLKNKSLKMVNAETFIEDPLRVLRAVQFCSRFNLKMNKELYLLCKSMIDKNMLFELPKERIHEEIKKLLLKSDKPSLGFKLLKELGALKYFPNLQILKDQRLTNSLIALDKIAKLKITNKKTNEILMLTSLCYDFNPSNIKDFISKLSNDKELLNRISLLCENLDFVVNLHIDANYDYKLFKLSTKVSIKEITILSKSIYNVGDEIIKRAKELNILNEKMPAILMGRDLISLGITPSNKFSKILDDAYEAQMHKKFTSYDEGKKWLYNYLFNHK
jgi:tRNA nucleotidyltransferase (CCA-adding enzyme)